jgi:very-short-patch-repair endonuclease
MVVSSVSRARRLRRSMTGVELMLWSRLRRQQLEGHRFRRQAPIGPYIADFACFQARLLIEIDGPSHDDRVEYDRRRTAWLVRGGFRVLRFAADDVLSRLDDVLETILWELDDSAGPPSPGTAGDSPDFAGERRDS